MSSEQITGRHQESELQEVNQVAIRCYMMLSITFSIMAVLQMVLTHQRVKVNIGFLILLNLPVIISCLLYKKKPGSMIVEKVMAYGYAIFYTYALFTSDNQYSYMYFIPLLIVCLAYADIKTSLNCSMGGLIVNILYTFFARSRGYESVANTNNIIQRLLLLAFIVVFMSVISRLIIRMNARKIEQIEKEKEIISRLLQQILDVSGTMMKTVDGISSSVDQLENSTQTTCNAMEEVTQGTTNTVESIVSQTKTTEVIRNQVKQVQDVSSHISERIEKAKEEIRVGQDNISSMIAGVKHSEAESKKVTEELSRLDQYTSEMEQITELINGVTKQTSLLSLNASIEAARAGEAGRGFAVVASEISQLSTQTQDATVNITNLIHNVSEELKVVIQVIQQMMENNRVQNDTAAKTVQNFEIITDHVNSIAESEENLACVVKELTASNTTMVDSIETVSAVTEEVSAHSIETFESSKNNIDIVSDVKKLVTQLSDEARTLQETTKEV